MSSVALIEAGVVLGAEQTEGARQHAEALAPMLARVVRCIEADQIRAVACDVGPGPYSGLRVAIASAIACGLAWNVPVFGICSLDAIAAAVLASAAPDDGFGVAIDARRNEVYWAWYSVDGDRAAGPRVARRDELPSEYAAGRWFDSEFPHASWVARSVERLLDEGATAAVDDVPLVAHGDDGGDTATALAGRVLLAPRPLYLRRPDVTVSSATVSGPR